MRIMAESDVKHQLSAEWAFEKVLAKLGDKAAKKEDAGMGVNDAAQAQGNKGEMEAALKGLDGVLARLALGTKGAVMGTGRSKGADNGFGKGVTVEVKVIRIGDDHGEITDEFAMEDLGVIMDSVKRKRKKKISKHKYKKRRKVSAPLPPSFNPNPLCPIAYLKACGVWFARSADIARKPGRSVRDWASRSRG